MDFTSQLVLEITAPNNVPFLPGYDIIGIGSDLPSELLIDGAVAAIVFYSSDWNAAAVVPSVKYYALVSQFGGFEIEVTYSDNPSTTAAQVFDIFMIRKNVVGGVNLMKAAFQSLQSAGNADLILFEEKNNPFGGGIVSIFDRSGSDQIILDGSEGWIQISDRNEVPPTVTSTGTLYVESGALKYKGSSGTVTTLAPA